jgi:TRAP transporter TAXI family solute receptor
MNLMKRKWILFWTLIFAVSLLALAVSGCAPAGNGDEEDTGPTGPSYITVAAGSPGGVYFPLGAGIAKVITDKVDGVVAQSESTGASVENSRLVGSGESDMGMAMANVAYDAYAGQGSFEGDQQNVVALFSMYPAAQHLIVSADSDIYSVDDLVGKRISVDAAGSGAEVTSYIILEAAGIRDDVNTVNFSQPEAADALKDGIIDGLFYNFAFPGAIVNEILTTKNIRFIPLTDDLLDTIIADYPYFTKGVIPAGVYELTEDISALTVGNLMLVNADMDDDTAYNYLTAIFNEDSLAELVGIHPIARLMNTVDSAVSPIPLHPGAERFFREN